MHKSFKPDGYTSVAAYLVVQGAAEAIDFLVAVFDAERLRSYPGPSGKLGHAEVRIDDTVLMLGDSMEGWPAVASHVHIYVADVDQTYARALAAGATGIQEPTQKDDEDRRGGFTHASGITCWVASRVS